MFVEKKNTPPLLLTSMGFFFLSPKETNSPPGRGKGWVAGLMPYQRVVTHPYPSQEGTSRSHSGSHTKKPILISPSHHQKAP
jgi:hypothetical protein